MTAAQTHANRKTAVPRLDAKAQRSGRQCIPDTGLRARPLRSSRRDDRSRTPPAGDPLVAKR